MRAWHFKQLLQSFPVRWMLECMKHIKHYRVSSAFVAVIPTIGLPHLPELAPIMTQCVRNLLWAIANLQTAFMLCFHCCLMSRSLRAAFAAVAFQKSGCRTVCFCLCMADIALLSAVLYCLVLCSAVLCPAVLCCVVPCHATSLFLPPHAMLCLCMVG